MISSDTSGRRYETSPEGVLSVVPPPDSDHAIIASRLMGWFFAAGVPHNQFLQVLGIRIPGAEVDGGRIPDLTLWAKPPSGTVYAHTADLLLAIEIISRGSEAIDRAVKPTEYASAGIPHYWTVARDNAETVTRFRLGPDGAYQEVGQTPLAWLLRTAPADHVSLPG
ncbi:Uma2 family endonuclease [Paractinoplanes tereljensis]|uniref:Uma2 family endonuclease n=1 Tax=Paractinoplanes tereljensis TaxID=571912 RepID=UPI001EF2CD9A|nr:Uma2 family endonuclease [Actinoplanes tereljensis]